MSETVKITKEIEVCVYDVTVDGGYDLSFSAEADSDGDLRIEVSEGSIIDYLKEEYTHEDLIEMFGIEME